MDQTTQRNRAIYQPASKDATHFLWSKDGKFCMPKQGAFYIDFNSVGETGYSCPECGASMVWRWSRFGDFMGCTNYPECTGTRDANGATGRDSSHRGAKWNFDYYQGPTEEDDVMQHCGFGMGDFGGND